MKAEPRIFYWIILTVIALVGISITGLALVLPYPVQTYFSAKRAAMYSSNWPISKADYLEAKALVEKELKGFEIIDSVHVESSTKIRFEVLERYWGPLAAAGCSYEAEKLNGKWSVSCGNSWVS